MCLVNACERVQFANVHLLHLSLKATPLFEFDLKLVTCQPVGDYTKTPNICHSVILHRFKLLFAHMYVVVTHTSALVCRFADCFRRISRTFSSHRYKPNAHTRRHCVNFLHRCCCCCCYLLLYNFNTYKRRYQYFVKIRNSFIYQNVHNVCCNRFGKYFFT